MEQNSSMTYIEAMDKIASHLRNAAIELTAAKSLSTALMAKTKAERIAKGHTNGGMFWALTSCFETAANKSLAIISEKLENVGKRLHKSYDK